MSFEMLLNVFRLFWAGKVNFGFCPICSSRSVFIEFDAWLRDYYRCARCHSIPRQRALIQILTTHFPEYHSFDIHESSPGGPASEKIARKSPKYIPTQFFLDTPLGSTKDGVSCENLERMTFPDESFDLVITQDVLEHVFHPDKAFADIGRTLKPGGAHLFTVPLYPRKTSVIRAVEADGSVEHLQQPDYHGNRD